LKKRLLPTYVSAFRDRHGHERLRFRRIGQKVHYFQAKFGTEDFRAELRACLDRDPAVVDRIGADRNRPGSISTLIAAFYTSQTFTNGGPMTQRKNRGLLESFRTLYGNDLVIDVQFEHLDKIIADRAKDTPFAARNLRKQLRRLFEYAVKTRMRPDNPVDHTERVKAKSDGYAAWSDEEVERFQAHHKLGTMPRLAFEIMLWTGLRKGDAIRVTKIVRGEIHIRQEKTDKPLILPASPQIEEAVAAMPLSPVDTLIHTSYGKSFTPNGFGNRFHDWVMEAGIVGRSAHGLRKTLSRRLAEHGQSNQSIKAVTGHSGDSEVALYTRSADQRRLAKQAIGSLAKSYPATPLATPQNNGGNAAENRASPIDVVGPAGVD
jgi:integrase